MGYMPIIYMFETLPCGYGSALADFYIITSTMAFHKQAKHENNYLL